MKSFSRDVNARTYRNSLFKMNILLVVIADRIAAAFSISCGTRTVALDKSKIFQRIMTQVFFINISLVTFLSRFFVDFPRCFM